MLTKGDSLFETLYIGYRNRGHVTTPTSIMKDSARVALLKSLFIKQLLGFGFCIS
jgi:hypothetical protein